MICPECGTVMADNTQFCCVCGRSLISGNNNFPMNTEDNNAAPAKKGKSPVKWIIIAVAVVAVIAIAVAVFVFTGKDKNTDETGGEEKALTVATAEDLKYELNDDGESYCVKGFISDDLNTKGSFTVPSEYEGKPVTVIGEYAFSTCDFSEIILPDELKTIDRYAFSKCENLEEIELPKSVRHIKEKAFSECQKLAVITVPGKINTIGADAFSETSYYNTDSNWEDGVLYLDNYLINTDYTAGIIDYKVKAGTKVIADNAFMLCKKLKSVDMSDGVVYIGAYAFKGCNYLSDITIGEGCRAIGTDAFIDTKYYNTADNWEDGILFIDNQLIKAETTLSGDYTVPKGTENIACNAFYGCEDLESITIPASIVSIGDYAFGECLSLETVTVNDGVEKRIDKCAFSGCANLTTAELSDSVTAMDRNVFERCYNVTIVCSHDSVAHDYALKYSIKYELT